MLKKWRAMSYRGEFLKGGAIVIKGDRCYNGVAMLKRGIDATTV